jgi:predicted nucleic-acid-binding protein
VIGLDTNVIIRYVVQDDKRQAKMATELIERLTEDSPGFLTLVCLTEIVWVLESAYAYDHVEIFALLTKLMQISVLKIERQSVVAAALRLFKDGKADFADCLIERVSGNAGCLKTLTFDVTAAKTANMVLIR